MTTEKTFTLGHAASYPSARILSFEAALAITKPFTDQWRNPHARRKAQLLRASIDMANRSTATAQRAKLTGNFGHARELFEQSIRQMRAAIRLQEWAQRCEEGAT